jgi:hypothetical protein
MRIAVYLQGPVIGQLSLPAAAASQAVALAFDSGLVANTDYLLKLIAVDAYGNCQVGDRVRFGIKQLHSLVTWLLLPLLHMKRHWYIARLCDNSQVAVPCPAQLHECS